jgi:hypothetical protein
MQLFVSRRVSSRDLVSYCQASAEILHSVARLKHCMLVALRICYRSVSTSK